MILGLIPNYIQKKIQLAHEFDHGRHLPCRVLQVAGHSDHHLRLLYHGSWQRWPTNIQQIAIVAQTLIIYLFFFDRASGCSGFAYHLLLVVVVYYYFEKLLVYFFIFFCMLNLFKLNLTKKLLQSMSHVHHKSYRVISYIKINTMKINFYHIFKLYIYNSRLTCHIL